MTLFDVAILALLVLISGITLAPTRWRRFRRLAAKSWLPIGVPGLPRTPEIDRQVDLETQRQLRFVGIGGLGGMVAVIVAVLLAPEPVRHLWPIDPVLGHDGERLHRDHWEWAPLAWFIVILWLVGSSVGTAIYVFRTTHLLKASAGHRVAHAKVTRLVDLTGPGVLYGSRLAVPIALTLAVSLVVVSYRSRPEPYLGLGDVLCLAGGCLVFQIAAEIAAWRLLRIPSSASTRLELAWADGLRRAVARSLYVWPMTYAAIMPLMLANVSVRWGLWHGLLGLSIWLVLLAALCIQIRWRARNSPQPPPATAEAVGRPVTPQSSGTRW